MLDISLGGAFLAGLLSFVSPCVLPIVPPYLAWLAGVSFEQLRAEQPNAAQRQRVVFAALTFVLGFSTVFVALGATASVIGRAIAQYFDVLSVVAGVIIILMGLHFLGVFRLALLYREARVQIVRRPAGFLGAYVIGLAFAFGWTPCAGPVLAAILFVAGSEGTAAQGALLLALYSSGIGLPFLLAALFASRFLNWAARLKRHMRKVEMAMGALLVVTGVLFITGQMSTMAYWLLETFPAFQSVG
ncbi:cytochrome C biogenesis protein CcdA [Mesorhizobium tianshanense]|uniref:Cytochrome c-type biogenesis protein n=1 Tax=Mesorhizobium tianshanense TaxID=39844 RepID=A0A562PBT6_9HYPH|nr:cytochrome c biogenesis protein CcdA [Mesorhizobium tianshanense]TWI41884.1 cytochrome c-type biogenesis protein [Mesorhizobium tianshanense]GLS34791.1 cytochrome C biogenesis protein CcdA [Mesorhizobium tianshanense]